MISPHASSLSIFWGYGVNDTLIREEVSKESVKILTSLGIPRANERDQPGLFCKVYNGIGHETSREELADLQAFIKKRIPGDT